MTAQHPPETLDEPSKPESPLACLKEIFLSGWEHFPEDASEALDEQLSMALARAEDAPPEVLTVMNPVSRPQRLKLGVLATDAGLDRMYSREWAEFSVSSEGRCYLIYRRRGDSAYAIEWSHATTLPETMLNVLPDVLVLAVLQSGRED